MGKKKAKYTPGQQLYMSLYRADQHEMDANRITENNRRTPEGATKYWGLGMARSLKEKFREGLRRQRESLGLSQQELASIAELTATAVAMIERGERSPSLETAARLCWALDVAAGVTSEDLL